MEEVEVKIKSASVTNIFVMELNSNTYLTQFFHYIIIIYRSTTEVKNEERKMAGVINDKEENVFGMAKAFLSISEMTHKKLQKLCYYAKAWHLALYDYNIIDEPFQAWVHGAVQPDLYQKYKKYRYSNIPKVTDTSRIPETFLFFAKQVYDSYGHLTGDELEQINHQEEPWILARGDCKPWESCTTTISEDSMKSFYRKMICDETDSES